MLFIALHPLGVAGTAAILRPLSALDPTSTRPNLHARALLHAKRIVLGGLVIETGSKGGEIGRDTTRINPGFRRLFQPIRTRPFRSVLFLLCLASHLRLIRAALDALQADVSAGDSYCAHAEAQLSIQHVASFS
jgi:hypothetical protein